MEYLALGSGPQDCTWHVRSIWSVADALTLSCWSVICRHWLFCSLVCSWSRFPEGTCYQQVYFYFSLFWSSRLAEWPYQLYQALEILTDFLNCPPWLDTTVALQLWSTKLCHVVQSLLFQVQTWLPSCRAMALGLGVGARRMAELCACSLADWSLVFLSPASCMWQSQESQEADSRGTQKLLMREGSKSEGDMVVLVACKFPGPCACTTLPLFLELQFQPLKGSWPWLPEEPWCQGWVLRILLGIITRIISKRIFGNSNMCQEP